MPSLYMTPSHGPTYWSFRHETLSLSSELDHGSGLKAYQGEKCKCTLRLPKRQHWKMNQHQEHLVAKAHILSSLNQNSGLTIFILTFDICACLGRAKLEILLRPSPSKSALIEAWSEELLQYRRLIAAIFDWSSGLLSAVCCTNRNILIIYNYCWCWCYPVVERW